MGIAIDTILILDKNQPLYDLGGTLSSELRIPRRARWHDEVTDGSTPSQGSIGSARSLTLRDVFLLQPDGPTDPPGSPASGAVRAR
jgi:hypothetical protein